MCNFKIGIFDLTKPANEKNINEYSTEQTLRLRFTAWPVAFASFATVLY